MIQSTPLRFSYSPKKKFSFPALSCEPGESILILGPSGSGKTSWLHLLAGLLKPELGEIIINGIDITKLSPNRLDLFRGKHIGLILQKPVFFQSLSVKENLSASLHFTKTRMSDEQIFEWLQKLQLGGHMHSKPEHLSQGELQRLAFIRTLMSNPSLILADEPTAALDDKNTEIIASILLEQAKEQNSALIIITHDYRLKHIIKSRIEIE